MRPNPFRQLRRLVRPALALTALALLVAALQVWNRNALPANVTVIGWQEPWPEFGGWSGLDVSADGRVAWMISDGSLLARADLLRDADGTLQDLRAAHRGFVERPRVAPPFEPERRGYRDAESLSLDAQGRPVVTFERFPRLLTLPPGRPPIPHAPLRTGEGGNSGVEAFALATDGARHAVPERPQAAGWPYTLWTDDGTGWRAAGRIPRQGRWRAAGADMGPDGMLYLLERGITAFGFTSRVRALDPDRPRRTRTVYLSPPGRHGNLEGLGVWQDTAGRIRLLMVADDNFLPIQRGGLVEVTLPLAMPAPGR